MTGRYLFVLLLVDNLNRLRARMDLVLGLLEAAAVHHHQVLATLSMDQVLAATVSSKLLGRQVLVLYAQAAVNRAQLLVATTGSKQLLIRDIIYRL